MVTQSPDIVQNVTEALLNDSRTKQAVIEVIDQRGMITLIGVVDSVETSRAAEEIARQQPAVVSVVNELKIA
jgi:osmotically-inducible protein OsmY